MKLNIGFYEVEIKARAFGNEKANKRDTMYFLNHLALALDFAAERCHGESQHGTARCYESESDNIDDVLQEKGFYDQK